MIVPTIGRIVWYRLNSHDVEHIGHWRRQNTLGGNPVAVGDEFPAIVVRAWGNTPDSYVNLKVLLDGPDDLWACSRKVGEEPGDYRWMPYQVGQAKKHEGAVLGVVGAPAMGGNPNVVPTGSPIVSTSSGDHI